jgi:5-(carboxyamino)imidazole ribonucleotide mutase
MANNSPVVGILMGSDCDWLKIKAVGVALDEFGISFEVNVMSAHRNPPVVAQSSTTLA